MIKVIFAVGGYVMIASMCVMSFCMVTARQHVDNEKLRQEKDIAKIFNGGIVPERVLTPAGLRRMKTAKTAAIVLAIDIFMIIAAKFLDVFNS